MILLAFFVALLVGPLTACGKKGDTKCDGQSPYPRTYRTQMTPFQYKSGVLHADGVSLTNIADAVGTPFYCYSDTAIVGQFDSYVSAFADQDVRVCYAMKANDNLVLRALADRALGSMSFPAAS